MPSKVMPSFDRNARSREFTALLAYSGGSGEGIVWPSSERLVEDSEGDLATGPLNAFDYAASSGLTVTIDTGEAIVRGAYCATDETHDVTLPENSTTTVYVGWRDSQADELVVGTAGDFHEHDPSLAIWTFETDGSSVISSTSERPMADAGYIDANSIKDSTVTIGGTSVGLGETLGDVGYLDFSNSERGDYDTDGRLYYDLSAGLYIKASNAPNSETGGRLLWSGGNVSAGSGVSISYGSEDRPTIKSPGVDNLQTSEPAYTEGETWLDPDPGIFYVAYDDGGGGDWHPIPPVATTEETVTFSENDVNVNVSGGVEIIDESITFPEKRFDDFEHGEDAVLPNYTSVSANGGYNANNSALGGSRLWFKVNPGYHIDFSSEQTEYLSFLVGCDTDPQDYNYVKWYIQDADNNDIFAIHFDKDTTNDDNTGGSRVLLEHGGGVIEVDASFTTNYGYSFEFEWDFANNQATVTAEGTTHSGLSFLNSASGYQYINTNSYADNPNQDLGSMLDELYSDTQWNDTGTATVGWNQPPDIDMWYIATYRAANDGGSVTIDVQRYDGSSWVTEYSDISPDFDITDLPASDNVRLKFNFSRSDFRELPRADYAARRFIR